MTEAENQPPAWAQQPLQEARNTHPGRREGEVGISTLAYDPARVNDRLHGRPAPGPEGDHLAKGTMLHQALLGNAPYRELEVRLEIEGTGLYLNGRFDAYDPAEQGGTLRDLKTTDRWDITDQMRERYETQLLLYAACVKWGEVNTGTWDDPNWQPAQQVLGEGAPRRAVVDVWPAGDIQWAYLEYEDDDLEDLAAAAHRWACEEVRAMVAGSWAPDDEDPDDYESTPLAPDELATAIHLAGRAKETRDEADQDYDDYREQLYENQDRTLRSGPWKSVYYEPKTQQVLNTEKARQHVDLEAHQDTRPVARVTDEEAFAEWAANLGSEIPGVELDTKTRLDEEALREVLKDEGVLDDCLETEVTRSGYVSVTRTDGGGS